MSDPSSIFLISSDTFKKSFLAGAGQLELTSDKDMWMTLLATGGRFSSAVSPVADVDFNFGGKPGEPPPQKFQFGGKTGMKLGISASVGDQIHLIWPDQEGDDAKILKDYELTEFLTEDNLYVRLLLHASADVSADTAVPVGALRTTFGITSGGNVAYERLKLYNADLSAKAILSDLFAGVRLPQQIDSAAELPDAGELLVTRFGGYLQLRSGLSWGYQLAGSESLDVNQLKLNLDYALRTMASVSVGYKLAGDFSIEARRGAKDGWVRFVVRKSRDSQFNFAADFNLDTSHNLQGLPQSADEFLVRLIGADAQTILDQFHKAQQFDSLDKLEAALTPMAKSFVHEWAQTLIGKALTTQTFTEFFSAAKQVADVYENLDERILSLYHNYLNRIPALQKALALVAGATNPAALAAVLAADNGQSGDDTSLSTLDLVMVLWSSNIQPLLMDNQEFLKFSKLAGQAQSFVNDGPTKPVREFIAKLNESLPLDSLFGQLEKIKTADDLKNLADTKLQDLAARLLGKTFDELKKGKLDQTLKSLQQNLKRIDDFKNNWYAKVTEAVNQKFTFDLNFAYTRAAQNSQLLDIEFDLNTDEGRAQARQAAAGNFDDALANVSASYLKINKGVFTHELTISAHLRINVMGWGYDSLTQLASNAERTIEPTAGGLLNVFATEASIKERVEKGGKFKKTVESNFLLRVLGDSFQPDGQAAPTDQQTRDFLIQTLRSMTVQYDLLESDEQTTPAELSQYLDMAVFLGLLTETSRSVYAADLAKQFPPPTGLGKVVVRYLVRYDEQMLKEAFKTIPSSDLKKLAQQTMRQVIGAKFTGMRQTDWQAPLGFAYLSDQVHDLYEHGFTVLRDSNITVTLPGWFTKGAEKKTSLTLDDKQRLITLCNLEKSYVDRLIELNDTLHQIPIKQKDLEKAARRFVEKSDDVNGWRGNAFFAIFDKLVQEALHRNNDKNVWRQSSMTLEITPPGAKDSVKKILMQQQ